MRILVIILFFIAPILAISQSVGINESGTSPHPGAILDISSGDKGVLIPRLETTAVSNPANGMLVFQPSDQSFYFYKGTAWEKINSGNTNGVSFETTAQNLIRSTGSAVDNEDLIIGRTTMPGFTNITDKFFFYDQSSGAFRGGKLDNSSVWAPINIGNNSFAYGENVKADGPNSIALGQDIEVNSGSTGFAIGLRDTVTGGLGTGALGYENNVAGTKGNIAIGSNNEIDSDADLGAVAIGYNSRVHADSGAVAIGKNVSSFVDGAVVVGRNNSLIYPVDLAFAVGNASTPFDASNPHSDGLVVRGNGYIGINDNFPSDMMVVKNKRNLPKEGLTIVGDSLNEHVHVILNNRNEGGNIYSIISSGGTSSLGKGKFIIRDLGSPRPSFTIDSLGNIGFRTADPVDDLHLKIVDSDDFGGISVEGGTDTKEAHLILDSEANNGKSFLIGSTGSGASIGPDKFTIRDMNVGEERLTINTFGNLGVGTSSPAYKLTVKTSPYINEGFLLEGDPLTKHLQMRYQNNATNAHHFNLFSTGGNSPFGDGKFIIRDVTTQKDQFILDSLGNFGLGRLNPQERLHLRGAIVIDTAFTNNPGTIQFKDNEFRGYDGTSWVTLGSASGAVSTYLADADGDTEINVEDTPDLDAIRLKLNNSLSFGFKRLPGKSAYMAPLNNGNNTILNNKSDHDNSLLSNILIGANAGLNHNSSVKNIYIGVGAAKSAVSTNDVVIGHQAMLNAVTPNEGNVVIGSEAAQNMLGFQNLESMIAIGRQAGQDASYPGLFIGEKAGLNNKSINNTFIGFESGMQVENGFFNTFIGWKSGTASPVDQAYTTVVGADAGRSIGRHSTIIGALAGQGGTTAAERNTFVGNESGKTISTGKQNTFVGDQSGKNNTSGKYNTFLGADAGLPLVAADKNTYIGAFSGKNATAGHSNTMLGYDTYMPTGQSYTNASALGAYSFLRGSHEITIGGTGITDIGGYSSWSNLSDGRFKENVKTNVPGLDFITQLRPVTYKINSNALADHIGMPDEIKNDSANKDGMRLKAQEIQTGFIAQEVEAAAQRSGFNFSGVVAPDGDQDTYRLRYAEFVVPLVKAVQEQQEMIESLQEEIENLKKANTKR